MSRLVTKWGGVAALCSLIGLNVSAVAAAQSDGSSIEFRASVASPATSQGIYKFTTDTYAPELIAADIVANGGGFEADAGYYGYEYYFTYYDESAGKAYNGAYYTSNWGLDEKYVGVLDDVCTTIAYSPLRDDAYGCAITADGNSYNFVRWKGDVGFRYYGSKTVVAPLERPWAAAAFHQSGNLIALERNGDIYKVKTLDGAMTKIGATGIEATGLGDAVFDGDNLYWAVSNDAEKALYKVSFTLSDGDTFEISSVETTKLYDFANGEEICGMYIPATATSVSSAAPAQISSIATISFPNSGLTGTMQFQRPSRTEGGSALDTDSELTYIIRANGVEVARGAYTVASGYQKVEDITVPVTDNYYFTVTSLNDAGESKPVGKHQFVGQDTPKAPTYFTAKQNGDQIDFTWYAPSSTGINGGTIDTQSCLYTIVRYPDEKVVVLDITERQASDTELPDPEEGADYYYVLSTKVGTASAPDVKSDVFHFGPLSLPYTWVFKGSDSLNGWTFPSTNKNTWTYSSYYGALSIDGYQGFDDWAITPVVGAKAGVSYPVSVTVKGDMYNAHDYEVAWGTDPTAEAMVNKIIEFSYLGEDEYVATGEFSVPESGNIYIGVHVAEDPGYCEAYLVKLEVAEGEVEALPSAPESARFIENGDTGEVTITWEPVTTDTAGKTLEDGQVTYRVIDRSMNTIAEGLEEPSFTYQAAQQGEQKFVQFGVYAVTSAGESEKMAATDYKPVGKPYETPWSESFENGQVHSQFGYNWIIGTQPWEYEERHDWGILPQDNDKGFAYFEALYGDYTALLTGKISLEALAQPVLTYYTYNYENTIKNPSNVMEIHIDNGDGNGFVKVNSTRISETGPVNTWNKVTVPLDEYAGKSITVRFYPGYENDDHDNGLGLFTLDNIRIDTDVEHNLIASRISAPLVADINKPFEVEVTVFNAGSQTAEGYTVDLMKGDTVVATSAPQTLAPNANRVHTFELTLTPDEEHYIDIYGVVNYDLDENDSDNKVGPATIGTITANVPEPTGLVGTYSTNGVQLSWIEPDLDSAAPASVTEDFESASAWTSSVQGWKMLDEDNGKVGGVNISTFPIAQGSQQSWFVVDYSWTGYPESGKTDWEAHSGNKYMASEYVTDNAGNNMQSDDWAISPRLYGGIQTLSFYAKSFSAEYLETFEVLVSNGTTNKDDFETVATVSDVPNAWTLYRFKLPEGSKYAAIRSRSYNKFFLFVDDINYTPYEGAAADLAVSGYHVYRDGVKLTSKPVESTYYSDVNGTTDHKYFVTAVYTEGESRASNVAQATTAINDIGNTVNNAIAINAHDGGITVTGLNQGNVVVIGVDGRVIATVKASGTVEIPLATGIYIVKAADKTAKVLVK